MFQKPEYFFAFLLLIPLGLLMLADFRRSRQDLSGILGKWRASEFLDVFTVKWFFTAMAVTVFTVFLIFAAAEPEKPGKPEIRTVDSRDIIFALDLSRSMLASDSSPTRLERSLEVMRNILAVRGGTARFGLVVFTDIGSRMIPSTEDLALFETVLQNLGPGSISSRGSDLAAGLETAVKAFPSGVESDKILLLFSDGENFGPSIAPVLSSLQENDIRLITLGAGTPEGAGVPAVGGGFLKDSQGNTVITRLMPEEMTYLADETGGEFLSLNDPGLMRKIEDMIEGRAVQYSHPREPAYRVYLLIAFAALIVYFLVRTVRWKRIY